MSTEALVMMILICGLVWGGFLFLLVRAIRQEGAKGAGESGRSTEHPPHPSP